MRTILGTPTGEMQVLFSPTYCALRENAFMLIYSPAKIIALREERGLSQSELARRAKLSAPSVWALEEGKTKMPKFQTLTAIAGALGVPIQALMSDKQPVDIDDRIAATAAVLNPANRAALLAVATTLLESQRKK